MNAKEALRIAKEHVPNGCSVKRCWFTSGEYVFSYDEKTPDASGLLVRENGSVAEYSFFPSTNRLNLYENLERLEKAKEIRISELE